jgi:hypothetical protein
MEATVDYRFHIALRDVSPEVWRRMELTAHRALADLAARRPDIHRVVRRISS